jgi:hypothetical protein
MASDLALSRLRDAQQYDPERLLESQLTEAEFADIGFTVVACLAARFDRNGGTPGRGRK